MKYTFIALSIFMGAMTSCGGGEKTTSTENSATENTSTEVTTEEGTQESEDGVVEVTIESNDQMKYNLSEIKVKAGSTVVLTLVNVGTMPKDKMGHNWTLLNAGIDSEEYALEAANAADNDYQVKGRESDVLAHTAILGPGETETLTFTAPEAGSYKYVCTFPAHYGTMNGVLIVE
jgi:azurin